MFVNLLKRPARASAVPTTTLGLFGSTSKLELLLLALSIQHIESQCISGAKWGNYSIELSPGWFEPLESHINIMSSI